MMQQFKDNHLLAPRFLLNRISVYGIGLLLSITSSLSMAEPVKHWKDSTGQWHFGDGAAASQQPQAKAVNIENPISIIKNDNANQKLENKRAKIARKTSRPNKNNQRRTSLRQLTVSCEAMRTKLQQAQLKPSAVAERQRLVKRYEQQCISGHYYGN